MIVVSSTSEVFSLVLAEAMAAGVVPIAYASEGPAYILEDFPEHLVPLGDVTSLAARLRHFAGISHDELREALHLAVERRFSPERIAQQWKELLT
jgi:poly(glycerol-phosphate) alpha-glucosyltransferase